MEKVPIFFFLVELPVWTLLRVDLYLTSQPYLALYFNLSVESESYLSFPIMFNKQEARKIV